MESCKLFKTIVGLSHGHQSLDDLNFFLTLMRCDDPHREPYVKPTVKKKKKNLRVIMDSDFLKCTNKLSDQI